MTAAMNWVQAFIRASLISPQVDWNGIYDWLTYYNDERTHQGKMCCGRTPMQTLIDGKEVWRDKITTLNS